MKLKVGKKVAKMLGLKKKHKKSSPTSSTALPPRVSSVAAHISSAKHAVSSYRATATSPPMASIVKSIESQFATIFSSKIKALESKISSMTATPTPKRKYKRNFHRDSNGLRLIYKTVIPAGAKPLGSHVLFEYIDHDAKKQCKCACLK